MNLKRLEITSVKRRATLDPLNSIVSVSGNLRVGYWTIRHSDAVKAVLFGKLELFVVIDGREEPVVVAESNGVYYLKAAGDEVVPAHLLKLPETE